MFFAFTITDAPEWFWAPMVGGVLAALGYVGKLFIDLWIAQRERIRMRRAHLAELGTLLKASTASFSVQCKNRNKLAELIRERDRELAGRVKSMGYEALFGEAYPSMTPEEKRLHGIVRSFTMHAIKCLNDEMRAWLKQDCYFRAPAKRKGIEVDLADELRQLEVHLLLWDAKYRMWIPEEPAHALVYLADEEKQGIGFPKRIEDLIRRYLNLGVDLKVDCGGKV